MTKLTDEELANVRTLVPAECIGLLRYVDVMAAELRDARAQLAKMRPVYEAAVVLCDAEHEGGSSCAAGECEGTCPVDAALFSLHAAVKAARKVGV